MNRYRTLFHLCFMSALLMSGPALAQDAPHPPATCGSWEVVYSPSPNGNGVLFAVAHVLGHGELWSVGYY